MSYRVMMSSLLLAAAVLVVLPMWS
eukprot:COSAG01_NODE_9982_length_2283_cov_177.290293_5_plen_24_part_01